MSAGCAVVLGQFAAAVVLDPASAARQPQSMPSPPCTAGLNSSHIIMANSVLASWTACVKDLQQMFNASSGREREEAGLKFVQRLDKLDGQPPLPHAAWKRLAQKVQVSPSMGACFALCCPASQMVTINRVAAALSLSPAPASAINKLPPTRQRFAGTVCLPNSLLCVSLYCPIWKGL